MDVISMRDGMAAIGAWGLIASLITVLIQYLFCTERVPRPVLIWRSLSIGAFFCSLLTRGLSDEPVPLDWNTMLVWGNLAAAQTAVMVFTYRRIIRNPEGGRGDRCPHNREIE
jgi:hypothetical protein